VDRPLDFKVYLCPKARGSASAHTIVEEALQVLGFPTTWRTFTARAQRRGPEQDELTYFSIDLTSRQDARVKLYVAHHDATLGDLQAVLGAAPGDPEEVRKFYESVTGGAPSGGRPPSTTLAFAKGKEAPVEGTLHLPIRQYVAHDGGASDRVRRILAERSLDFHSYDRALTGFATRPLHAGVGMHSYVSFCAHRRGSRITVYLTPEAYQVTPPRSIWHETSLKIA
jgi:hypothetical protein